MRNCVFWVYWGEVAQTECPPNSCQGANPLTDRRGISEVNLPNNTAIAIYERHYEE